jgi:hypothetical protein
MTPPPPPPPPSSFLEEGEVTFLEFTEESGDLQKPKMQKDLPNAAPTPKYGLANEGHIPPSKPWHLLLELGQEQKPAAKPAASFAELDQT